METSITASPGRCGAVALGATLLLAGLAAALLPDLAVALDVIASRGLDGAGFEQVVVWLAELALLLIGSWLGLVTGLVAGSAARGRAGTRGVPRTLGRMVLLACGGGLVATLAAPAHATGQVGLDPGRGPGPSSLVVGQPLPDRTTAARHVSHLVALATAPRADRVAVTVRTGDTLWSLAESTLHPGADDTRVTTRWQRIHAANRHRIGPDPDLIVPGLRLLLPRPYELREES